VDNIDHTRTKVKSPQRNGIVERFHRSILNEFYRVKSHSAYVKATNSWRFMLEDEAWNWPGVRDVTVPLRRAASRLENRRP